MVATFREFEVSARLLSETGVPMPAQANTLPLHYRYRVAIKKGDVREVFDYYGSEQEYIDGIKELNEQELFFAFYCIMVEAVGVLCDYREWLDVNALPMTGATKRAYDGLRLVWPKLERLGLMTGPTMDEMMKELFQLT
jgi:hypothetical protein